MLELEIIKTDNCPSLSGKSTLTYHIGKSGTDIQFRIHENTGAGRFSNEWLPLKAIEQAVGKTPFTSAKLKELFHGKSINTSSFMLAVLLNEGLAKSSEMEKGYVFDASKFINSLKPTTKRRTGK